MDEWFNQGVTFSCRLFQIKKRTDKGSLFHKKQNEFQKSILFFAFHRYHYNTLQVVFLCRVLLPV